MPINLTLINTPIKLIISPSLQAQVLYLCSRINRDEWSGILLYDIVEGEIGEPGCVIKAEELYFQDIGNSVYTEYEYNTEFVQFMIDNPQYLDMKKGHIHSHNNMGVFFSNTDNKELIDNSEFHNFYLSLIVNNFNDMTAKVAFRASTKHSITSTFTFNDSTGAKRSRNLEETKEELSFFYYDCEIDSSPLLSEEFLKRVVEIEKENKEKQKVSKQRMRPYEVVLPSSKAIIQQHLYPGKKEEPPKKRLPKGSKKEKSSLLDNECYSFLSKLLTQDYGNEENLALILEQLTVETESPKQFYSYLNTIEESLMNFYRNSFPEDAACKNFSAIMIKCEITLEKDFYPICPQLIEEICEILTKTVD
jgi:proteasome lid subunit RPN8/RPN11